MDAWNSPKMQKLREEFLTDNIRMCKSRMHNMACHKEFEHLRAICSWEVLQEKPPVRLDLRLNGQCNLSCVMCDVWKQPNGLYDESFIWRDGPEMIFPHLVEVDLLGGEPFIQKDTFRLIEAVRAVNSQCHFNFVTNAHYPWTKRLQNLLNDLPMRYVQVSVDSLQEATYAKMRQGDFYVMRRGLDAWVNLAIIRASSSIRFQLKLSMVVSQDNWREIPEFVKFCSEANATPVLQMIYYDPGKRSSLLLLDEAEKYNVVNAMNSWKLDQLLTPILNPLAN
jgi:cyclic pyranopterin phosphate synthase